MNALGYRQHKTQLQCQAKGDCSEEVTSGMGKRNERNQRNAVMSRGGGRLRIRFERFQHLQFIHGGGIALQITPSCVVD